MKTVIMQPTWLPWMGYFDLIDRSDCFIFLDSVQFEKQSWQQRNRIVTPQGLQWVTVPVLIKGRFGQEIKDVEIDVRGFPAKLIRQVRQNYSRTPYYDYYIDSFEALLSVHRNSLCELCIDVIVWMCDALSLPFNFLRSSNMRSTGKRSERLVSLLREVGSKHYHSPLGSAQYLKDDTRLFAEAEIEVSFQHYEHPAYQQMYGDFIPGASALDLLFNCGPDALKILRSGQRLPYPFSGAANA